jgi:SAM-dependent methyltransferase
MSGKPWFQTWFGEAYKTLYPHRDAEQAHQQVAFVTRAASAQPGWSILDIGCGMGRHLEALRTQGYSQAIGIDLSATLLRDARALQCAVARADMRRLPFSPGRFDLIMSLFTSFGYFAKSTEDLEALAGFGDCLKPAGYLFLDLPNREHVVKNLVARDERILDLITWVQERRVESHADGDQVVKRIEMRHAQGVSQTFEERVRLYGYVQIEKAAQDCGLRIVQAFGDESGAPFHPGESPRMALLLQRKP